MSREADLPLTGTEIVKNAQRNDDWFRPTTQEVADLTGLTGTETVRVRRGKRWAITTVADIAAGVNGGDIVTIKQGKRHLRTTAQSIADLGGASYEGPLDLAPALAAYSNRALSAAKRGTALYTINGVSYNSDAVTGDAPSAAIILAGGGTASIWNDQSGNNFHLVEHPTLPMPTWTANEQNGKPALVGDQPTNATLLTDGPLSFLSGAYTIFIVVKGPAAFFASFDTDDHVSANPYPGSNSCLLDAYSDSSGNEAGGNFNNTVSATDYIIWDMAWEFGSSSVLANGINIPKTTDLDSGGALAAITDRLSFGFSTGDPAVPGRVLEVLSYDGIMSDPNRLAIRQNIATYYGVPLP